MEKNKLRELIEQSKSGSRKAMTSLENEYRQSVRSVCRTMIKDEAQAETIAADAFRTAFERLEELDSPEDFLPWVTQIAREKCGGMRVSTGSVLERSRQTGLSKAEKTAALQRQGNNGTLSNDVIWPQPAQIDQPKKKSKLAGVIIAVAIAAALALAAGVAILFAGRDRMPPDYAGELSFEYSELPGDDILDIYRDFFESNYDAKADKLFFHDITNDGASEMLVIQRPVSEESLLYIYTLQADGSVKKIYDIENYGTLESLGGLGLCEYDSKQCIYELVVHSWAKNGSYDETIFCLDGNGERTELVHWDQTIDDEPLDTGIFHFTDYDEIRKLGMWMHDAFGTEDTED